jgi:hypothetical protein
MTGKNIFGIGIGGNYILSDDISLFAKTNLSLAKKYEGIYYMQMLEWFISSIFQESAGLQ